MAKKGVYKISGNTKPTVGKKEFYIVDQWYPATPLSDRNLAKVTWELFIKTDNGFRSTNVKKKGINHFTFGKNAYKYVYKIEGYLHEPEGNSPMSLIVYPQKNEEKKIVTEKNIKNVVLTYENGSTINKTLSYRDRLQATAICEGLEGEKIVFKLWEDDEAKNGHNNKNQFITKSPPVEVNKFGKAKWSFSLNSTFISLANKREDDKSKHEYYVTAEFSGKILEDSQNVNVTNPEYKIEQPQQLPQHPKRQPRGNSSPKPKQESPKASTRPSSPNNQPDKKGKISSIKLVDIHGKQFSKNPKFGDVIKLIIEGKDVVGKPYRLKLWEHDNTGEDDLLYNQEHTFKSDKQEIYIRLLDEYRTIGEIGNNSKKPDSGEYWTGNHQEIFAEVIFLGIKSESQRIDIDLKEEPKKEIQHVSPAKVEKTEISKTNTSCVCKQYDLIWGEKVSCEFRKKVVEIAKELWLSDYINMANNLMAIMALETNKTFDPKTSNKNGYFGLIGFGNLVIEDFQRTLDRSITKKKIIESTAVEQLYYVKERFKFVQKHLMNNGKGGILEDFTDLYLAVLYPSKSGLTRGEDAKQKIIFDASKGKIAELEYRQNPVFMKEPGEWSTKQEITFKRKGKEVTETLRGFKDLNRAKTYRWEITEEIIFNKSEGEKYKTKTYSCQKELKNDVKKSSDLSWHDPVINPMCTIFTQNQVAGIYNDAGKHWGLFGKTRGSNTHYGLDLFAKPGTQIFACVKCEVYKIITDDNVPKGYGKQIFLKVIDKVTFMKHYENYKKLYPTLEYEKIGNFSKDNDIILHYAHLRKIYVKKGWVITNVNIPIGETGVSGVTQGGQANGTCAPHLHFEIRNMNKERINPGFFIKFKNFNSMSDSEKKLQQERAKEGKIYEFKGIKDTYKKESDYE